MNKVIKDIALGLLQKSKNGQVNWVHFNSTNLVGPEGPSQIDDDYAVNTPNFSINIFAIHESGIRINIHNEMGDLVSFDVVGYNDPDYALMDSLLQSAKEYLMDENELLKTIKSDLAKPGTIGLSGNKSDNGF